MSGHGDIPIKVNARVDAKIAPLVLALNAFDDVLTLDSCQGQKRGCAHVYFTVYGEAEALASFCCWLARRLNTHIKGCDGYELRIQWCYDFGACMAYLETLPERIGTLAEAIALIANERRKTGFAYDRSNIKPRNSQLHHDRQQKAR